MRTLLVLLVVLSACDDARVTGVDLSGLLPMPDTRLPLTNVHPTQSASYWELRIRVHEDRISFLSATSGGRGGLDSATIQAIENYIPAPGISQTSCLIGQHCYTYLAAVKNQNVTFYDSAQELLAFLGDLDTIDEVALYLSTQVQGDWNTNTKETGYRKVADGWEVVLLQTASMCMPYRMDQVVVHITTTGEIKEIDRALWKQDKDACVVA